MGHQNKDRFRTLRQSGENQFVFVYGSLKSGFHNCSAIGLDTYACLATGYTVDPTWSLKSYGSFPAAIEDGDEAVYGEVYVVDDRMMAELDFLEGFPKFYDRRKVAIWISESEKIDAWMYFHPITSDYKKPTSDEGIEISDYNGLTIAEWVGTKKEQKKALKKT